MKRISILTVLVLATLSLFAERVTPETARKVATTFLTNNGAKTAQLTDLSKAAGFPNLYIFTAEQGFVVMAADDRVKPILGYSLTNTFVAEGMPENVRGWLQGYSDEIQYAVDNRMSADAETAQLWKDLIKGNSKAPKTTTEVAPLIQTKWDQIEYYNLYCPAVADGPSNRAYTGCVATAMAQIMKYWEYPSHGMGSHSYTWNAQTLSANFGETTYDWSNMKNYYQSYYDDLGVYHAVGTPSSTEIEAVSTLMYHCGVSLNMSYGGNSTGGSSASTAAVVDALKTYFNYSLSMDYKIKSNYTNDAWIALVKAELDSDRPLQYRGSSGGGGHSFICDGYDNSNNFHFNWGWAGWCNGFYSLGDLTTTDPGSGGGNGNYTSGQGAIFGIQPSTCTAAAPTGLTYTQNGQNVTLNWNTASGAASYNIYLDNDLIGNAATNSYATTAPFGTHFYYVRSVDGSGELSLSTNSVTVTVDYQTPIVNDLQMTLSGSDADLSWTAPAWCYPETPSATLTYGDGTSSGYSSGFNDPSSHMYWGHKYPSNSLTAYSNMSVYKVSFYANATGNYKVYIYKGTTSDHPETQVIEQSFNSSSTGWVDIILTDKYLFDASKDLWVFIYDPEGRSYPAPFSNYAGENGNFYSLDPTSWVDTNSGAAFLIRTYLTDGTYTYHLYDNGVSVADDIATTSYTVTTPTNNTAHQYTVKTNYYGGETAASNMAGLTLGTAELTDLSLGANDKMTVAENAKLTVTGTLTNGTAANLVIKNGGQLYTESASVQATVKKDITGYGNDISVKHGWNLIALPITEGYAPAAPMTSNTYDLYRLNPATTKWENYKPGNAASGFNLVNGRGYLYANSNDVTLEFAGTVKPYSIGSNTVPLVAGWNLVGNPYTFNVYSNKSFYKIGTDGEGHNVITVSTADDAIAPCRGIVVKSTNTDPIAFTAAPVSWATGDQGNLNFVLTQQKVTRDGVNETIVDNAIVSFNEGAELEKFYFGESNANLYIPQGQEEYAIVYSDKQSELPINFKAYENGEYTLTVTSPLTSQFSVLKLIDNLTGTTIDLLQTPSYTFEAKTSDYATRFRLIFNENENQNENDDFAFVNNGEIIVNGTGTLQIFDAIGREIIKKDLSTLNSKLSTLNFKPGVYILRTVNGNEVKTKKIIIK